MINGLEDFTGLPRTASPGQGILYLVSALLDFASETLPNIRSEGKPRSARILGVTDHACATGLCYFDAVGLAGAVA